MANTLYALISVSDKTKIVEFAQALNNLGVFIIATGGTAKTLKQADIPITEVADITQFPEMMGGRVKTLHPAIHGGLLGRRGIDDEVMQQHNIPTIDLLVCNLYPFENTVAKPDCSEQDAIENIDIGGPAMLRSAAKNFSAVTVITDPNDYDTIIEQLKSDGTTELATRKKLAQKVFAKLAHYNQAIADYLSDDSNTALPALKKHSDLRYGENPHQSASLYRYNQGLPGSLAQTDMLQGKPLSFNNFMDSEAALRCVRSLNIDLPACVIVKHATPCGVAQASNLTEAYQRAFACDSQSAFGGIIAFNQAVDEALLETIYQTQFVEVILAPGFSDDAVAAAKRKPSVRLLAYGDQVIEPTHTYHSISGGLLVQQADNLPLSTDDIQVVSQRQPTEQQLLDCLFAWQVVQYVKSNAIVYAKDGQTLGLGTGQTSRVFAAQIAALKAEHAGLNLQSAVMASDAFFPFADGIQVGIDAGIEAIIQPGGSKRDGEVIAAADEAGIVMLTTGHRHFRH